MIFIIGGSSQGKREFAKEHFFDGKSVQCADGKYASLAQLMEAEFICNFHCVGERILRGQLQGDINLLAEELKNRRSDRIITADETGCGIVPMDPDMRRIREETGRLLCRVASRSDQVWRVVCGLGQRIK